MSELVEVFHKSKLFDEICCISENIFDILGLDEEEMRMLETFWGQAIEEAFIDGVSYGMAQMISEDIDLDDDE